MYAVVVTVEIEPGQDDEARRTLHDDVVPRAKQAPGFINGVWMRAGTEGQGHVLFDTQEHARAVAEMAPKQAEAEPAIRRASAKVFEVLAQA
jgi:quinol monooxygenase YgiN